MKAYIRDVKYNSINYPNIKIQKKSFTVVLAYF